MQRFDSIVPGNAIQLHTTSDEDCAIRKNGDQLYNNPGTYNAGFRNCAYVARDLLYQSGYLSDPNTLGMIYTPNWVAGTVQNRAARRLANWASIGRAP